MLDVAIIGGGLSGLSLAHSLVPSDVSFTVFESRERFGGRIYSVAPTEAPPEKIDYSAKYDLGPSWVWPAYQPRLARFLHQHNIVAFPQWTKGQSLYQTDKDSLPQAFIDETPYASARRLVGGCYRLIDILLQQVPETALKLSHHLHKVVDRGEHVDLHFNVGAVETVVAARQVAITLPPRLTATSITFSPELDARFNTLMENTVTWMGGHAKAVICYDTPFWRASNYSGSAFAVYPGAALAEIFDATLTEEKYPALSGFFALPALMRQQYRDDLEALILAQLVRLFGNQAAAPKKFFIKDWFSDPLTATAADEIPPQSHPQYGHDWFQLDHWKGKMYFAGTETAREFGGYLEGALESAERVRKALRM